MRHRTQKSSEKTNFIDFFAMRENVERNLQKNLRGMTLSNFSTVGDVRALRKCEKSNHQMDQMRSLMDRTYASDLRSAHLAVEFSQKRYAGQLLRIESDKQRAIKESADSDLVLKNATTRQKMVTSNGLRKIIKEIKDSEKENHRVHFETEEQKAEKKERLKKVSFHTDFQYVITRFPGLNSLLNL